MILYLICLRYLRLFFDFDEMFVWLILRLGVLFFYWCCYLFEVELVVCVLVGPVGCWLLWCLFCFCCGEYLIVWLYVLVDSVGLLCWWV